ncbi:MAG: SH3 domain-containing protein [Thermoguttaceae bacterium]|nr:SH3 domain-containing protein [Thermoguttaceae bacterium]MDW8037239.1 SH3 domain-containing protein [Thermoguttaceae bacterium]
MRSGPGVEYYPTDILQAGQIVEVYRHDPAGWCAIRPPEGSFSWVWAEQIEILPDGLGKAKQDQVPVVVGSRLTSLQDVVQVYLKQAEAVELLEEETLSQQKIKGAWYKIAPPSGEFRWIFSQDISPLTEKSGSAIPQDSNSQLPSSLIGSTPASMDGLPQPAAGSQTGLASSGGADLSTSYRLPTEGLPGRIVIPPNSGGLSSQEFQQQLQQIELELANRIMPEPTRWQLQDLYTRAESLLGQAPDASSRSEARQLLARISRFLEVQQQYAQILLAGRSDSLKPLSSPGTPAGGAAATVVGARQDSSTVAGPAVPPASTRPEDRPTSGQPNLAGRPSQSTERFDAMGRLTRVVSAKPGAPTYALLDAQGEVVCYLTPAPGINLHPLEGKWIAVTGITGLMLEPRAKHVAVKQVALVDPPTQLLR